MSKGNTFENELLALIFNNTAIANIGDASGLQPSATAGSLYVSLHTADPGEAGDQTTNEVSYTGYARQAVARNGSNWTVSGNGAENTNAITFPECSDGASTVTHFAVGTAASGTGKILYSGALTASLDLSAGTITPEFAAGELDITED